MSDYADPLWGIETGFRRARLLLHWGKPLEEAVRQLSSGEELTPEQAWLVCVGAELLLKWEDERLSREYAITKPVQKPGSD